MQGEHAEPCIPFLPAIATDMIGMNTKLKTKAGLIRVPQLSIMAAYVEDVVSAISNYTLPRPADTRLVEILTELPGSPLKECNRLM